MNTKDIVKQSISIVLNIIAYILVLVNYIIPIYEYDWMKDLNMSGIVNSNAVLNILILSVLSLILATIAFIPKKNVKKYLFIYIGVLIFSGYKLIQASMLYTG